MLKIIYKGKDLDEINIEAIKASECLRKFFPEKNLNAKVYVYQTRAAFDKKFGEKSEDWVVGSIGINAKIIYILSPLAFKNESCHDPKEFLAVLEHELTHLYSDNLANGKILPKWLDEGLAQYIAKQYKYNKDFKNIEKDFCKKLGTLNGWNKRINSTAYPTAVLFVNFLIKNYSFNKIKELITSLNKIYYYPSFKKIFFKVYGYGLKEVEQLFIKSIDK